MKKIDFPVGISDFRRYEKMNTIISIKRTDL